MYRLFSMTLWRSSLPPSPPQRRDSCIRSKPLSVGTLENNRPRGQTSFRLDAPDHIADFGVATHTTAARSSVVVLIVSRYGDFLVLSIFSIFLRPSFIRIPSTCFIWRPKSPILNVTDTTEFLELYGFTGMHTYILSLKLRTQSRFDCFQNFLLLAPDCSKENRIAGWYEVGAERLVCIYRSGRILVLSRKSSERGIDKTPSCMEPCTMKAIQIQLDGSSVVSRTKY